MIDTVQALPVRLASVTLGSYWSGMSEEVPPPGVSVPMLTGPPRRQVWEPAASHGAVPVPALTLSWSLTVADVDDYVAILRAQASGLVAAVLPVRVGAVLPTAGLGGSSWTLTRALGYGSLVADLPAVRELAPPLAWLDGVPLTVLDSGVPGAGEIVIPDSGSTLTTATDLGGTALVVLYLPRLVGYLTVTADHVQHNDRLVSVTFTEAS